MKHGEYFAGDFRRKLLETEIEIKRPKRPMNEAASPEQRAAQFETALAIHQPEKAVQPTPSSAA